MANAQPPAELDDLLLGALALVAVTLLLLALWWSGRRHSARLAALRERHARETAALERYSAAARGFVAGTVSEDAANVAWGDYAAALGQPRDLRERWDGNGEGEGTC